MTLALVARLAFGLRGEPTASPARCSRCARGFARAMTDARGDTPRQP